MIDRYINGRVDRISPEAPVPIVRMESIENRLGGAANVALNTNALGANSILCSIIGEDENSQTLLELLPKHRINPDGIIQSSYRQTTVKTRISAQNQQLLRVDKEDTSELNEEEETVLLEKVIHLLNNKQIDVILFQDYNKGVLSQKVIRAILLEAIKRDIPTAVDPKYKNFWAYNHVTLFKPNLKEIANQLNFPIDSSLESMKKAAKAINSNLGNDYTLITLSEKGLFWDNKGKGKLVPTTPRSIADVSGAGDTVISIAALGLVTPQYLEEIPFLANLAGGQVCEKLGVVPVDKEKLIQEYHSTRQTSHLSPL